MGEQLTPELGRGLEARMRRERRTVLESTHISFQFLSSLSDSTGAGRHLLRGFVSAHLWGLLSKNGVLLLGWPPVRISRPRERKALGFTHLSTLAPANSLSDEASLELLALFGRAFVL